MWRKLKPDWYWALIVALCGAVAGAIYALVTGAEIVNAALVGAVLSSAILTAIKMFLDPG